MRPQDTAHRLQTPENTVDVSESGKHQGARICSTLLPIRFPVFWRAMFFLRPERSEGAENMPRNIQKGNLDEADQGQHRQGRGASRQE
jgi:hypothetical protein